MCLEYLGDEEQEGLGSQEEGRVPREETTTLECMNRLAQENDATPEELVVIFGDHISERHLKLRGVFTEEHFGL